MFFSFTVSGGLITDDEIDLKKLDNGTIIERYVQYMIFLVFTSLF